MNLTIDANVFVAASLEEDVFHDLCSEFLLDVRLDAQAIYEPVFVLAEVAGVISRVRKQHALGDVAALRIENFSRMRLRIADGPFARCSARLASRHAISGADSQYLTVATEFGTTLVTLDDELLKLNGIAAKIRTPQQWLHDLAD